MMKERRTLSRWIHQDMTAYNPSRGGFETPGHNELLSTTPSVHEKSRGVVDQDHLGFQPGGRNYAFALLMESSQQSGTKGDSNLRCLASAHVVPHSSCERREQPSAADVLAARIIQSRIALSSRLFPETLPEIRDPEPSLAKEPTMDCTVSVHSYVVPDENQTGCNALNDVYASAMKGAAIVGSGLVGWCRCDAFETGSLPFTKASTDEAPPLSPSYPIEPVTPTVPNVVGSAETRSVSNVTDAIVDAIQMAHEEAHTLAADAAVIMDSINLSDAFEMAQEEATLLMADTVATYETTSKGLERGFESAMGALTGPSDAVRGSQVNVQTSIATTTENFESSGNMIAAVIDSA
jgi:hypothetical protein